MSDTKLLEFERAVLLDPSDATARERLAAHQARLAQPVVTWLRERTWSGPCFRRGQLVRETASFYVVSGPDDRSNGSAEKRLKKHTSFHTDRCDRCSLVYGN